MPIVLSCGVGVTSPSHAQTIKPGSPEWVDKECHVGDTFGRVVQTRLALSNLMRVWRPGLPVD